MGINPQGSLMILDQDWQKMNCLDLVDNAAAVMVVLHDTTSRGAADMASEPFVWVPMDLLCADIQAARRAAESKGG